MKLKKTITQGNMARWSAAVRELKPADVGDISQLTNAEYYSVNIKAAIKAEWFENGATPEQVDDMTPKEAQKLSREVWDIYLDAYRPDPN